jgi:hypothetical protein
MRMSSRLIPHVGLAGLVLAVLAVPARAGTLPLDALPLPNRVATADLVVAGKVTAVEAKPVTAAPFPGAARKIEYRIAVVTLSDALPAPRGRKTVRLGFVPTPPMVVISPPPFQPAVGQEGVFFLTRHGEGDFYLAPGQLQFLGKIRPGFDKDLAVVKRCVKILEDPHAALKGSDVEDQFLAAAMLVARYRTARFPSGGTEPIDAGESRLILEALAAADWTPGTDPTRLSPQMVLGRLPLTKKDAWEPPSNDPKAYAAYARKWLKDHAGSYRIEKFVTKRN